MQDNVGNSRVSEADLESVRSFANQSLHGGGQQDQAVLSPPASVGAADAIRRFRAYTSMSAEAMGQAYANQGEKFLQDLTDVYQAIPPQMQESSREWAGATFQHLGNIDQSMQVMEAMKGIGGWQSAGAGLATAANTFLGLDLGKAFGGERGDVGRALQRSMSMQVGVPLRQWGPGGPTYIDGEGRPHDGPVQLPVSDLIDRSVQHLAYLESAGLGDKVDQSVRDAMKFFSLGQKTGALAKIHSEMAAVGKVVGGIGKTVLNEKGVRFLTGTVRPKDALGVGDLARGAGAYNAAAQFAALEGVTGAVSKAQGFDEEMDALFASGFDLPEIEEGESEEKYKERVRGTVPRVLAILKEGFQGALRGGFSGLAFHLGTSIIRGGGSRIWRGKPVDDPILKAIDAAVVKSGAGKAWQGGITGWVEKNAPFLDSTVAGLSKSKFTKAISQGAQWVGGERSMEMFHHLLGQKSESLHQLQGGGLEGDLVTLAVGFFFGLAGKNIPVRADGRPMALDSMLPKDPVFQKALDNWRKAGLPEEAIRDLQQKAAEGQDQFAASLEDAMFQLTYGKKKSDIKPQERRKPEEAAEPQGVPAENPPVPYEEPGAGGIARDRFAEDPAYRAQTRASDAIGRPLEDAEFRGIMDKLDVETRKAQEAGDDTFLRAVDELVGLREPTGLLTRPEAPADPARVQELLDIVSRGVSAEAGAARFGELEAGRRLKQVDAELAELGELANREYRDTGRVNPDVTKRLGKLNREQAKLRKRRTSGEPQEARGLEWRRRRAQEEAASGPGPRGPRRPEFAVREPEAREPAKASEPAALPRRSTNEQVEDLAAEFAAADTAGKRDVMARAQRELGEQGARILDETIRTREYARMTAEQQAAKLRQTTERINAALGKMPLRLTASKAKPRPQLPPGTGPGPRLLPDATLIPPPPPGPGPRMDTLGTPEQLKTGPKRPIDRLAALYAMMGSARGTRAQKRIWVMARDMRARDEISTKELQEFARLAGEDFGFRWPSELKQPTAISPQARGEGKALAKNTPEATAEVEGLVERGASLEEIEAYVARNVPDADISRVLAYARGLLAGKKKRSK